MLSYSRNLASFFNSLMKMGELNNLIQSCWARLHISSERNFDPSPHPHRNGKTSLPGQHFFTAPPLGKLTLVSMALPQKTFAMLLLSVVRDSTFSQREYILGFSSVCIFACFQNDQSFPDADCLSTNDCGRVLSCPFRGGER